MERRGRKFFAVVCVIALALLHLVVISCSTLSQPTTSGSYGNGFRYNIQGWVYLHIEGDAYERGFQYGYLTFEEIIDMITRWSNFGHSRWIMKFFF